MKRTLPFYLLMVGLLCQLLAGCGPKPASPSVVSPFNPVPYLTRTPVYNPTPTLPATSTPEPSPTPVVYVIVAGDTLSVIAQRFGVSLEALQTANPGLQPAQLAVGQTITIPAAGQNPSSERFATPVPADLGPVACFSSLGGLTCLAPVHNSQAEALENVEVQVILFGVDGQPVASQAAFLPLNLLPPGQTLPASVHFPGLTSAQTALAQLKAATRLAPGDQRYLPASVQDLLVRIAWDGSFAQVEGQVRLLDGQRSAGLVWLAAIAYDSDGQIAGYRRWDWEGTLPTETSQAFELMVYSYGPAIDQIEVLVEARP